MLICNAIHHVVFISSCLYLHVFLVESISTFCLIEINLLKLCEMFAVFGAGWERG